MDAADNYHHCAACGSDFRSEYGLTQHFVQSPRHFYCQKCDIHFPSEPDLEDHYYYNHYWCEICRRRFNTELGLREHTRQKHELPIAFDFNCPFCDESFASERNLQEHQGSSTHQPRLFKCYGIGCGTMFVSEAGLALHWESGTCNSGVTREALDSAAMHEDSQNIVTIRTHQLSNHQMPHSSPELDESWNGNAYECPHCPREFIPVRALIAHVTSTAHQQRIYKCPPTYDLGGCSRKFKTFSGLLQHVDSGTCGVLKIETKRYILSLADGLGVRGEEYD
ncbi:hypothetical protein C8Q75DRAFT_891022 [Abortiporus biennis]|nr:hypothetical protein C8Q75DRAFT_891022 [Abortiporus biennis]